MGAGLSRARARARRWRSPALMVSPPCPNAGVQALAQVAPVRRPTRPRRARRSRASSLASGAPERRFSASGGAEEVGPLGQPGEVGPPLRHRVVRRLRSDPIRMAPAAGGTKPEQGSQHGGLARARRADQRHPAAAGHAPGRSRAAPGRPGRGSRPAGPRCAESPGSGRWPSAWRPVPTGRRRGGPAAVHRAPRAPVSAAAWPSVLAWNSAPARRRGTKISGATSRTAMAVWRREFAPQQPQAEDHGHEAHAEAGDEVHGQGGEEGHPQRPHGGLAHPLGGAGHLAAALLLAPEGAQRRQSFDELEEAPGQRAQRPPLPLRPGWRPVGRSRSWSRARPAPGPPPRPARASPGWPPRPKQDRRMVAAAAAWGR